MFTEEEKFLPFSGGRYKLNQFGEILDQNDFILEIKILNNKKFVLLSWYDGVREYEVGTVVIITHFNFHIPTHLWNQIETIYEDGNGKNVFPLNLSYRFKDGPIEIPNHPGFFYIPYYTNYGINLNGELLCLGSLKIKNWLVTKPVEKKNIKGGYRNASARHDSGSHRFISRHRAIGLTFIRYESNPLKLIINHLDGVPGNDFPSNLEWTTHAKNNQHAYDNNLFPNKVVKILMKNLETGEIKSFPSIVKCAEVINWKHSSIYSRLQKTTTRYSDNFCFKLDDGTPWPEFKFFRSATIFQDVAFRNVFTNAITIVKSAAEAERLTGIDAATIRYHCSNVVILPIHGYNFRFLDPAPEWPEFTEKHLRIFKMFPSKLKSSGVVVKNANGEEIEFYESLSLAAKKYNVRSDTIRDRCYKNLSINGKNFSLFKVNENLGPPTE